MSFTNNKTFCVVPFIHKHKTASPKETLCFYSKTHVDNLQDLRQKLVNGKRLTHCSMCYYHEDNNLISYRMKQNEQWLSNNEIKEYIESYNNDSPDITYSCDIIFNNKCNLACIGCGPDNSSLWAQELNIPNTFNELQYEVSDIEHAKFIYIGGGEPFLSEQLIPLLKLIAEKNNTVQICLHTNLTTRNNDIRYLSKELPNLSLHVSIDGIDKVAEYHRYPINYTEFLRNLEWAKSINCNITFATLVDAINVSFIHEIMQLESIPNYWVLTNLLRPEPLLVENLPDHLKQNAYDNFIKLKESTHYSKKEFQTVVDMISDRILQKGDSSKLASFINTLDARRNINHVDYLGIQLT